MDVVGDLLVIVDPTAADQPAVEKAGALAAALHANVELLACDTPRSAALRHAHEATSPASGEDAQRLRNWLDSLAAPLRTRGVDVRCSVIRGENLHDSLIRWIRNSPADLVLKDTHHHSLMKRTFLGSTDSHLIRDSPLPLLLVKPTRWRSPPALAAAVDPGHAADPKALLDQRILDWTLLFTRALKAEMHVLHAYFPAAIAPAADYGGASIPAVSPEVLAIEKLQQTDRIAALLATRAAEGARVHIDAGMPAQYLPAIAAECRIDLVIMGAHSRGRLVQAIIGNTAERVLESLPCDVLVVRTPDLAQGLPAF